MKVSLKSPSPVINLHDFNSEDIEDVLLKIEASFDIKFNSEELKEVKTFGGLCDVIVAKVKLAHAGSCTTQQAFYKLRNTINNKLPLDRALVKPQTRLSELFPRDNRIEVVADIENELGFHMNLLQPKPWTIALFSCLLFISLIFFYFNSYTAVAGLVISLAGLKLAGRFGRELKVKTLGELSEKIAREHFLKCRRDASTVNRTEIVEKVKELFAVDLAVKPGMLTKSARFA